MQLRSSFLAIVSFAALALASTVATVESDIAKISAQVTTLNNAINTFATSGGLANALAIHTDATSLVTSINTGTTDVNGVSPKPVAESDGQTILASVQAFEPTIISALNSIVKQKAAFQALPIGGIPALVKQDLGSLNTATSAFEAALIGSAPSDLVSQANAIKSNIDTAFAAAISAYAQF